MIPELMRQCPQILCLPTGRASIMGMWQLKSFYGTKSHAIHINGIKSKGKFPNTYRDYMRDHGAPSALRRDNAKEEQSEAIMEINREYMIKDQYTEPYHPQQNPVESNAIRYLKNQIHLLLDRTGAPDSAWFIAAQYVADVHNICSDPSLPNEMTPIQYQKGVTPDISVFLQFTFWQPILYLDHESHWPESKERSARWVGVAHNIGDALTFWVLDDQSKYLLARSVVRPFNQNLRVKWDPSLVHDQEKDTATHGGEIMPEKPLEDWELVDMDMSKQIQKRQRPQPQHPRINQYLNQHMRIQELIPAGLLSQKTRR